LLEWIKVLLFSFVFVAFLLIEVMWQLLAPFVHIVGTNMVYNIMHVKDKNSKIHLLHVLLGVNAYSGIVCINLYILQYACAILFFFFDLLGRS